MSALKNYFFHEPADEFEVASHIQVLPEFSEAEPEAGKENKNLNGLSSDDDFDDAPDSIATLVCLHDS